MRQPNYKIFIYDHVGRFVESFKTWAVDSQMAMNKGRKHLEARKRNPNFYTIVPRFEGK